MALKHAAETSLKSKILSLLVKNKTALIIIAIAMILRVFYLLSMIAEHGSGNLVELIYDSKKYIMAADYLFGRGETGQYELYLVGLGYPFFLALCKTFFGQAYWLILIIQIILGSLSCALVYKTAQLLIKARAIAITAGVISVVSITSISLANALLTETLFFFLLTLSLYLFFKGLTENSWITMLSAGITGGLAVLVRSVIIFFPILLIVFALIFPLAMTISSRKQLVIKSVVAAVLMAIIPATWGFRNSTVHDTFTVSGTGIGAARLYLVAEVLFAGQERPQYEFKAYRDSLYESSLIDIQAGNYKKHNDENYDLFLSTLEKYPALFIKRYFLIILKNATAVSSLHYIQIPQFTGFFEFIERLNRGFHNPVVLILSLGGFIILSRKKFNISLILLLIMLYFALMSGVTFGQGSRIFYPAMMVQSILVATTLLFFYDIVLLGKHSLMRKIKSVK